MPADNSDLESQVSSSQLGVQFQELEAAYQELERTYQNEGQQPLMDSQQLRISYKDRYLNLFLGAATIGALTGSFLTWLSNRDREVPGGVYALNSLLAATILPMASAAGEMVGFKNGKLFGFTVARNRG